MQEEKENLLWTIVLFVLLIGVGFCVGTVMAYKHISEDPVVEGYQVLVNDLVTQQMDTVADYSECVIDKLRCESKLLIYENNISINETVINNIW